MLQNHIYEKLKGFLFTMIILKIEEPPVGAAPVGGILKGAYKRTHLVPSIRSHRPGV